VGDRPDNRSGDRQARSWLDPTTGVQALVEVQRRGLLAAGDLVDRLTRTLDGDTGDGGGSGRPPGDVAAGAAASDSGSPGSAARAADDLVQLWMDVVRLGLDLFGQVVAPRPDVRPDGGADGATVDLATGASTGLVRIRVTSPEPGSGGRGSVGSRQEIWMHNGSGEHFTGLALHCGDLRASDGSVLPAGAVQFDPQVIDLPARSSRGIVVSVQADAPPGIYRGVVLTAGLPEVWLPIEVVMLGESTGA
jgi:hypothetical protein